MVNPLVVLSWLRARANKPLGFLMLDENGTLPIDVTLPSEPHPYATDGTDLSTIFADADALYAAYHTEDYSHIHVGDYWPLRLTGTYRDYGTLTCQQGQTYYSDTNLTQSAGTASQAYDAVAVNDASIPGCHKLYCEVTISGTKYYCSYSECLEYRERTLNNALLKMEIAGINQYWRYGDSGSLTGNVPHLLLSARDCLPQTLRFRKANEVWEGQHIDQFTGDGSTAEFTCSGTVGTIGFVYVGGSKKTYNTDYTYASNKITFKSGKIPADGALIQVEWMDGTTPWNGSALYKTFNDPDYGILKLIQTADAKLYSHMLVNSGNGMRYYGETRDKTNNRGSSWSNRGPVFVPTEDEIWGRLILSAADTPGYVNLTQWPIFGQGGRRHISKGIGDGASRYSWWSASSTTVAACALVNSSGNPNNSNASYSFGGDPCILLV